jgi:hypothetical protein
MPKSTNSEQLHFRVPKDQADQLRMDIWNLIYEKTKDELYLYIRHYPNVNIQEVRQYFGYKKTAKTVINMCRRTGLPLKDLPAK